MEVNHSPQRNEDRTGSDPFALMSYRASIAPTTALDLISIDRTTGKVMITAGPDHEPVEVSVLAKMDGGIGDAVVDFFVRQLKEHPDYIFEEGEHSALLCAPTTSDPSAVYQLAVGEEPLTWHRHPSCAHRIITVTTGSGGAEARFSFATEDEIRADPTALIRKMVIIELPADAQICIRFNGRTYHQFGPHKEGHSAFAGISVHKNERDEIREVQGNEQDDRVLGSIPMLTHCVSEVVSLALNLPGNLVEVPRIQVI